MASMTSKASMASKVSKGDGGGDKEYQDIVNTIKKMVEAKRCACTLDEVIKSYRQMRHKKINFETYGYTSERDLLQKTDLFRFRVRGGQVYIELKPVKKKKTKLAHSTSKLASSVKRATAYESDTSSASDHNPSNENSTLIYSNFYGSAQRFKSLTEKEEQRNNPDEMIQSPKVKPKIEDSFKAKDIKKFLKDSSNPYSDEPKELEPEISDSGKSSSSIDNDDDDNVDNDDIISKYDTSKFISSEPYVPLKALKNELVSSKINPEQKLTKVQRAMQKMMISQMENKELTINKSKPKVNLMKPIVASSAKEAFQKHLLEERKDMERQIDKIHLRKVGGEEVTRKKREKPPIATKAATNVLRSAKKEVMHNEGPRNDPKGGRTALTKLNIPGLTLPGKGDTVKDLNFLELHVVNILHTKVSAHPNGYAAENMPAWYQCTFDKSLPNDWMDLVKRSNKFYIEPLENKSLLYAKNTLVKEESGDMATNFDDNDYNYV